MESASSTLRLSEDDYSLYTFAVDDDKNPRSFSPVVSSPVSISKIYYLGIYIPLYKYPDLSNPDGIWNIPCSRQNMITMLSC